MLLSLPPPVMLSLAIVLEVVATSLLPKTQQFTSLPATAAVLVAALSWLVYGQKLDIFAIIGIALILAGVVIINLFSTSVSH
ncbi:QacE family quaternary ammonium compound efflux SMR transporter [Vibrio splendidus]|uniref:EamA family transporter n=1 Tax=Vibrio splendidus TaxID=29497 RepID=UPI003D123571